VATVDEPPALIAAFVAHHLAEGAAEVHVFLDRDNPEAQALLRDVPGCFVTLCDEAYWAASTRRAKPPRHTARQKYNSTATYQKTRADWLLHCDADEFVRDGAALEAELANAAPELGYLRLPNVERVHLLGHSEAHIFGGGFRGALPGFAAQGAEIYGRFAKFLNDGVSGHLAGKGIVRTGRPYLMGVHFPRMQESEERIVPYEIAKTQILHFDGLTPLHFALKLLRRAYEPVYSGPPRPHGEFRKAQFRFMKNNADRPREVKRLADGAQGITAEQAETLRSLNALDERPFDPNAAVRALFPSVDLSPQAFDTVLEIREADLIAEAGFALET
jgi:hypothetical protein